MTLSTPLSHDDTNTSIGVNPYIDLVKKTILQVKDDNLNSQERPVRSLRRMSGSAPSTDVTERDKISLMASDEKDGIKGSSKSSVNQNLEVCNTLL